MYAAAVALLACPECGGDLELIERVLRCPRRHSFDVSRHGYVRLATGAPTRIAGDTAAMVAARERFLAAGHFAPIAAAVRAAAIGDDSPVDSRILEVGAGTGYYLADVLTGLPGASGVGLDVATPAVRRLARAHPQAVAVAADVRRPLPIRSGVVSHVLSVFAPRPVAELARVMAPGGRYVLVTPTGRHLTELIDDFAMIRVDPDKQRRVDAALASLFAPIARQPIDFSMNLDHADVAALIGMGPSARHGEPEQRSARLAALPDRLEVTGSVQVTTFRRG
ncbi:methyltransferase domain-containing protein [Skermania piniformis]|uniref:Methyltransferase domain-containing protein n=1 Tax=Skermania pinensis TaxID=39122 RepID=A0ABX8SDF5_9ACTN|nr:methyltransferase domain-containing protein [Skermania piniformis]